MIKRALKFCSFTCLGYIIVQNTFESY